VTSSNIPTASQAVPSQVIQVKGTGFKYTAPQLVVYQENKYTLVGVTEDLSGSVWNMRGDLALMNEAIVKAMQEGAGKKTIVQRNTVFSDRFRGNVRQRHGFLPVMSIDPAVHHPQFGYDDYGNTPLVDGAVDAILAVEAEAKRLIDEAGIELVNGVAFFVTDGGDNASDHLAYEIREALERIRSEGYLESFETILIGINVDHCRHLLDRFQQAAGITKFIEFKDATPKALGVLGRVISEISTSTSQALGGGGPSQLVANLANGIQSVP